MRPEEILKAFAQFDSPHDIRNSAAAPDVFQSLPTEPQDYVSAARQLLSHLTLEHYDQWTDEINTYQRFEGVLRELFYADKRSAEALIWIVEWSLTTPGLGDFGVNSLAAFVYQLDLPRPRNEIRSASQIGVFPSNRSRTTQRPAFVKLPTVNDAAAPANSSLHRRRTGALLYSERYTLSPRRSAPVSFER